MASARSSAAAEAAALLLAATLLLLAAAGTQAQVVVLPPAPAPLVVDQVFDRTLPAAHIPRVVGQLQDLRARLANQCAPSAAQGGINVIVQIEEFIGVFAPGGLSRT